MKTTIVYAHPWDGSFNKAILDEVISVVGSDHYLIDLNKDGFDPVMSEADLKLYSSGKSGDPHVARYNEILDDTDRIIFIFPLWWYDMPAIMRGFMDKVMLEGSAYENTDHGLVAKRHILKTYVFTTSNATNELLANKFGDPIPGTMLAATFEMVGFHNGVWTNLEAIPKSTEEQRRAFLANIKHILA